MAVEGHIHVGPEYDFFGVDLLQEGAGDLFYQPHHALSGHHIREQRVPKGDLGDAIVAMILRQTVVIDADGHVNLLLVALQVYLVQLEQPIGEGAVDVLSHGEILFVGLFEQGQDILVHVGSVSKTWLQGLCFPAVVFQVVVQQFLHHCYLGLAVFGGAVVLEEVELLAGEVEGQQVVQYGDAEGFRELQVGYLGDDQLLADDLNHDGEEHAEQGRDDLADVGAYVALLDLDTFVEEGLDGGLPGDEGDGPTIRGGSHAAF